MPHAAGTLVWAGSGCCSGPPGWACWWAGGRGPSLEPRCAGWRCPWQGLGCCILRHGAGVQRARGSVVGFKLWPESHPCPGGIRGWRVPTRKQRGHATHPKPGLLAARCRAWGPVPLGWPRQVSGVEVTGWSSIGATAGMPQPRPAEVLLPPGGPGRQLHTRWPVASDRTPAGLSRILSRGVTTGRSRRPVWGHETAECVFGWLCLVWTGCWPGPSLQKSCSLGTALCS